MATILQNYFFVLTKRKFQLILYGVYALACLVCLVYFCVNFNLRNVIMCSLAFLIVFAFILVEIIFKVQFSELFTILTLFLCFGGIILGSMFNMYFILPLWDELLHGISGVVFSILGYYIAKRLIKNASAFVLVLFAVTFSLSVALMWEMFEYLGTSAFGLDMQEDMIITGFKSYMLTGTHNYTFNVDNVIKTVIYTKNGGEIVLNGYLDIGLYDTLNDMLVCTVGTALFICVMIIDKIFNGKINKFVIPK